MAHCLKRMLRTKHRFLYIKQGRLFLKRAATLGLIFLMITGPVDAASASSKDARDSAPVLTARLGGGGTSWSNLKELRDAVSAGNVSAEAQLGEMLLRGDSMPADEGAAVILLEKAARGGHAGAAFRVGMLLSQGEGGIGRDLGAALAYFKAAAAGGEKEGFFNIGAAFASARGVKRDYGEALGWLIVAREYGADVSAETSLRLQIKSQVTWIAKGERRAKEIAVEFTGRKVTEFLPVLSLFEPGSESRQTVAPVNFLEILRPEVSVKLVTPAAAVDVPRTPDLPK